MTVIDLVLSRPRGTGVIYLALLILAIVSFFRIPVESTPSTELPELHVSTSWPGADPEAVCEQVTRPIEEAARTIDGVIEVSSSSTTGSSSVTVSFAQGSDMDVASMELNEQVSFLQDELPSAVRSSSVSQSVPRELESEGFLIYALTGAGSSVLEQIADDVIVPSLESIDGVSSVIVEGLGDIRVIIDIDTELLKSYGLTLSRVADAVRSGIVDENTGVIADSSGLEAVLRVSTVPKTVADLGSLIIETREGMFITLDDVSRRISIDYDENRLVIFRYNGFDQVSLQVDRSPGSNAVSVASAVKERIDEISSDLPAGIEMHLTEDATEGIRDDLDALGWRSLVALGAIVFVLLILNRSPLSTPLIISSIVFSAAIAVTAVYLIGYSINMLTLAALAIAFGLLVDGAVVVLEAIAFRRRQGILPIEAAEKGVKDVALPILGGILTTMVALIPLLASEGILRLYYQPFAFTVAVTLLASYCICLTLVPSLAGRWKSTGWFKERTWDRKLARGISILHHRPLIAVLIAVLLIGGSVYVFLTKIERGEDWGFTYERESITVWMRFPPGTPAENVDRVAVMFEEILTDRDGIASTRTMVTGEGAGIFATLTDESVESGVGLVIEAEAVALATTIGGTEMIYVGGINPEPYWRSNRSAGMMQTVELRGYDYQGLKNIAQALSTMLLRHPRVGDVDINWNPRSPSRQQLGVVFDREELADLSINPYSIFQAFRYNLSGGYSEELQIGDESIEMTFSMDGNDNPTLSAVLESPILTIGGIMELGDIVEIDTLDIQASIYRENGEYTRTVAWAYLGAERMSARFRTTLLENLSLPSGYSVYEDDYIPFWLRDDDTNLNLIVLLAILAVFAVTAIVFESFKAPLYVLAVIPMALVGVVAGFWAFDRVFTPQAYVGSVFLVGIAVNNSILLVDSFQKKKKEGMEIQKAADAVVAERLRPILQTTATTIMGLLPLVIWPLSAVDDLWGTLSFTVVCGMAISTPLVLIALPALIQLTSRKGRKRK